MLKGAGIDSYAELASPCDICSRCKTSSASHRKFERFCVPADKVSGKHFQSDDPAICEAVRQLIHSDEAAHQQKTVDECNVETDPETTADASRLARILATPDSQLPMLSASDRRHLHAA